MVKKSVGAQEEELIPTDPIEITAIEKIDGSREVSVTREPEVVLNEARKAAKALKDILDKKPNKVMFNKKQYLEFEDWQTLGKFYALTARVKVVSFVQYGDVRGFEATADVIHVPSNQVISSAQAMCLDDEENWGYRPVYRWYTQGGKKVKQEIGRIKVPLFQLKSMAQTRACAKALRNVLSWVPVLAGYAATPAEDMKEYKNPDMKGEEKEEKTNQVQTRPADKPVAARTGKELPDEQVQYFTLPWGKYVGLTLAKVAGLMDVRTGKSEGIDYLEYLVANPKNPNDATILMIKRYLEILSRLGE